MSTRRKIPQDVCSFVENNLSHSHDAVLLTLSQFSKTRLDCLPVHLTLVGVDLAYNWKAESPQTTLTEKDIQGNNHPFSRRLSLPFITLLDNVIGRFVTWQLVRRYPLIFGSWSTLHGNYILFSHLFFNHANRPTLSSSRFPRQVQTTIQGHTLMALLIKPPKTLMLINQFMRSRTAEISAAQLRALSAYMPDVELPAPEPTDLEAFLSTMERVYRSGLRIPQFKGLSRVPCRSDEDDDELSQEHRQPAHDPDLYDDAVWGGPDLNHSAKLLEADLVPSFPSGTRVLTGCYADIEARRTERFLSVEREGRFRTRTIG
ncbi:uncharacterized protein LACBIDRAFT_309071 [Laccaria bicolor S238N-H82]|uniref:Predicted protein n=1 Tax=Laccaria bicolor (strain S238N-H82 / ATCC MYA-4686) TaxID=486041 RepID=B0CVH1_LACBS|nr:uncharacterized protein LACBIDRAFT_309071 [Laccaria bicolor S238N-H82]EDR13331.1 predicted protein [Laccaria bicolor S238N-H82]|eukprot:XP_001875829.1 predicted protein [Laccaria bicolor S238N-H82]